MVVTRPATLSDLPELLRLCDQAGAEGVCPGVPMDPDSISAFATRLMVSEVGVLMVVEEDGQLLAACGAMLAPYHFNQHVVFLYGVFLWADRGHPGHGARAVESVEKWGRARGAHKMLLTINDTLPASKRGASFLSRRGYVPEETNFVRTL